MKYLILMAILASCGQQQQQAASTTTSEAATTDKKAETKEIPDAATYGAKLVQDKNKLSCDEKVNGQLIYSKADKSFYYCDDSVEQWVAIDLSGSAGKDGTDGANGKDGANGVDGKDGAQGVAGIDGKDGADGKNGVDGTAGINGKDGVNGTNGTNGTNAIAVNGFPNQHWTDPVNGQKWLFRGLSPQSIDTGGCSSQGGLGWRPPTEAQVRTATADGIANVPNAPLYIAFQPISNHAYYFDTTDLTVKDAYGTIMELGYFCVYN